MTRLPPTHPSRLLPTIAAALALAASSTATNPALAGPAVSADLDLGTSVMTGSASSTLIYSPFPASSPLYLVGFTLRAGWRFDVGPVWLLPELGGGYAVESIEYPAGAESRDLTRLFAGGRVGWSGVLLRPELRFEPSIFGHVGGGWYSDQMTGVSFDAGIALDLRIRERFVVGAQAGYDVVRVPPEPGGPSAPCTGIVLTGSCSSASPPGGNPAYVDPWVTYGVHAGWLFW